jgi:hypothetical protein
MFGMAYPSALGVVPIPIKRDSGDRSTSHCRGVNDEEYFPYRISHRILEIYYNYIKYTIYFSTNYLIYGFTVLFGFYTNLDEGARMVREHWDFQELRKRSKTPEETSTTVMVCQQRWKENYVEVDWNWKSVENRCSLD